MKSRISIYVAPALESALAERAGTDDSMRSRSAVIAAMAERYSETCRRHAPRLALAEWLLIFDAMNGCWTLDNSAVAARSIAMEVRDACELNDAHANHNLTLDQGRQLVVKLGNMDFATSVAVLDAAERFWLLNVQPDGAGTEDDPQAGWRAPVRALVGRLADDG